MMDPTHTGPKIEARGRPGNYVVEVPHELELEDLDGKARVYGSRFVEVEGKGGKTSVQEVPLTWEDLFDPQEGDRLMHSRRHGRTLRDTGAALDCLYAVRGRDDVLVLDDVRIDWKTPGVDPACPDIAVVPGVKTPKKGRREPKSFNEKKEGTSPVFVLEATSQGTAKYDRESKPEIYRQAKVPEIFLLDELKTPWELSGERRDPKTGGYESARPDAQGRLLSEMLGVYFSISASGDELMMEDAETGEALRKPVEESEARRVAERQAAEEAEGREAAQRQAAEEIEARQAAEERVERAEKRVEQSLRRGVEDLCAVLGLAWGVDRSAQVENMSTPQLEALRTHLVSAKSWPESFSNA